MKKILVSFLCIFALISSGAFAQNDLKVNFKSTTQCDTAGYQTMYMVLINQSITAITSGTAVNALYKVNGATPVSEVLHLITPLNPGDSAVLHFTTPYHFNQFITYNCMYAISVTGDPNPLNDTVHFTRTFNSLPGYGAHSNDTSICKGATTTLMMELTGNGPWVISFVMGTDTANGLPVPTSVISTDITPDTTITFSLLTVSDSNGCSTYIGQSITITVVDYPIVNLGHDTTMCADAGLLLDAGNTGANYTWWNGPGSQTNTADTSDWNGVLGNQIAWVDVNQSGCHTRDSITINWVTCPGGIEENANQNIDIYPNPTDGLVNINFNTAVENAGLYIEDVFGKVIYKETINRQPNSTKVVDFSKFENGIYFVVVSGNGINMRQKVLLQK